MYNKIKIDAAMTPEQQKFFETLFDPGQKTCFAEHIREVRIGHFGKKDQFFCINALHPTLDLAPNASWHRADKPRRADANVVCYRNFLIELDNMALEKQMDYVRSKVPITTAVYSGAKSIHFIISLQEPLATPDDYAEVFSRLQLLIPELDKACKNPSRLSRFPGVKRPSTNKMQDLLYIGERVPNEKLWEVLPQLPKQINYSVPEQNWSPIKLTMFINEAIMRPNATMLRLGLGGRNQFFFWLGQRMIEANYATDIRSKYVKIAYENLSDRSQFDLQEAMQAARLS